MVSSQPAWKTICAASGSRCRLDDQAAWHATDAVQATHPPAQSLGRYIARKSDTGWTVAFGHLNDRHDEFLIGYEARKKPGPELGTA
jgi:hypothetical protein